MNDLICLAMELNTQDNITRNIIVHNKIIQRKIIEHFTNMRDLSDEALREYKEAVKDKAMLNDILNEFDKMREKTYILISELLHELDKKNKFIDIKEIL